MLLDDLKSLVAKASSQACSVVRRSVVNHHARKVRVRLPADTGDRRVQEAATIVHCDDDAYHGRRSSRAAPGGRRESRLPDSPRLDPARDDVSTAWRAPGEVTASPSTSTQECADMPRRASLSTAMRIHGSWRRTTCAATRDWRRQPPRGPKGHRRPILSTTARMETSSGESDAGGDTAPSRAVAPDPLLAAESGVPLSAVPRCAPNSSTVRPMLKRRRAPSARQKITAARRTTRSRGRSMRRPA